VTWFSRFRWQPSGNTIAAWLLNADVLAGIKVRQWLLIVVTHVNLYCCNLSGGVGLNVWFTTNGTCVKKSTIYMWRQQAIIEWSRRVISIVAYCHSAQLCAHAARDFRSQHYQCWANCASPTYFVWLIQMNNNISNW